MERGGDEKGGQQLVIIRRCWGETSIYFSLLGGLEWSLGGLKKGINMNLIPPISLHPDLCPVWNTFVGVPTVHGFNIFGIH